MVPLLAVYIILLIALPLQLSLDTDALVESIKRNSPDIASERMGFAVLMVNVYNWGLHAVDVVLTIWFLAKALNGRRWAYIALIVYLVIATAASLISAAAGTEYLWAVISCDGVHIVMLTLLLAPKSVRRFFAAHAAVAKTRTRTAQPD